MTNEPVLDAQLVFAAERKILKEEGRSGEIAVVRAYRADSKELVWEIENVDGSGDIIKVGNRLYVAGRDQLAALQLRGESEPPVLIWTSPIKYEVQRLLAGADRLFAITQDGLILCYGSAGKARFIGPQTQPRPDTSEADELVRELAARAGASQGYMLFFGVPNVPLFDALLAQTDLQIVAVDTDSARVDQLRREYDSAGLYGTRISFHVGTIDSFQAPSFVARLVILGEGALEPAAQDQAVLKRAYESVRPYGGYLVVLAGHPGNSVTWTETSPGRVGKGAGGKHARVCGRASRWCFVRRSGLDASIREHCQHRQIR